MSAARTLAPLLGLLVAPATALPCDYAPQFVDGWPARDAVVPANAQGYAAIPFLGRAPMEAELYHPEAFAPIPVDTRSLGEHAVELLFEPLEPGITYDARIWLRDQPTVAWDFRFTVDDALDRTPPPQTEAEFGAYEGPSNSCESSGWYVTARADVVPDDDVVLYELVEVTFNDAERIFGVVWPSPEEPVAEVRLSGNVGREPLRGRCFVVRTVDGAGQRRATLRQHCFGPGTTPDAGAPQDAGGTLDAGEVFDAGLPADASSPDQGTAEPTGISPQIELQTTGDGCGCTATETGSTPAWAALLLGLLGLRFRRPR